MKTFIQTSTYIAVGFVFALLATSITAWTGNPGNPPSGNTPAPLNVSGYAQVKEGPLQLGSGTAIPNLTFSVFGSAIIDSLGVTNKLVIASGAPAPGKILTSIDAAGTVAWADFVNPIDSPDPVAPPPVFNPDVVELDYVNGTEDAYSETAIPYNANMSYCEGMIEVGPPAPPAGWTAPQTFLSKGGYAGGKCAPSFTGTCTYKDITYVAANGWNRRDAYTATCVARQAVVTKAGSLNTAVVAHTGNGAPTLATGQQVSSDSGTLNKICQIRGYTGFFSGKYGGFVSPSNNSVHIWDGDSWEIVGAGRGTGTFVTELTCYK